MNSEFEKEVIEKLTEIVTIVKEDHKILHGNGQPGLMSRVSALESELGLMKQREQILDQVLKNQGDMERQIEDLSVQVTATAQRLNAIMAKQKWYKEWGGRLGWLLMAAITIYEVFFK